ncbi:hypothetical protein T484DRAFT_1773999 [Baffinella frigidus]|nr:hypothetical protein T484DRAFT_1773999 [Cryptophyta sp. CCMP2293]
MGDAHVIEEDSIAKRSLKREPPKRRGADPEDLEDGLPPAKISRRTDDEVGSSSGRAGEDCEMISVEGDIGTASRSRRVALEGKASEKGEKVANLAGRSGGAERGARQRFSGGSGNKVADAGSEIRADGEERSSIRRGRGAEERAGRRGTVRGGDGRADGGADDVQECGETLAGPGEKTARAVADRLRISSTVARGVRRKDR